MTGTATTGNTRPMSKADSLLRTFYDNPSVPVTSDSDLSRRQAEMLSAVLSAARQPVLILDLGCGDGFATEIASLRNPGHRFVGLDWSAGSLVKAMGRGIPVIRAALEGDSVPVSSGGVDVVIMSEVIEHLVDTDGAVDEANRVLRPGGSLLLSTPNLAAWYNRALLAAGVQPVFSEVSLRSVFGRPGHQVAGHLHMFTRRALVEFLTAHGFACVRVVGARYHDVPFALRPVDRLMCRWPSAASILLVQARKV